MINVERLCDEFSRLASIASPSLHEGEIAAYLSHRLDDMGADVVMDDAAAAIGGEAGNIIARFPAAGGCEADEPLLLSAHMDTVMPAKTGRVRLEDGVFRSDGTCVLGADDKSGIAQIIEAITAVRAAGRPHPPLEVVISVAEEVGLLGVKHLDCSRLRARRGLVLDTSGVGMVANRAPCANKFRFVVHGVEAHAGLNPEQGVSAIQIAASAVANMRLGRVDSETTANIGVINGGVASNIIPNMVQLLGEARSFDEEKLRRQSEHMRHCLEQAVDKERRACAGWLRLPRLESHSDSDYPALLVRRDAAVLRRLEQAAAALELPLAVGDSGGGSDANIFSSRGVEVVNLATGMQQVHSVDEYIRVEDMAQVCRLVAGFISA